MKKILLALALILGTLTSCSSDNDPVTEIQKEVASCKFNINFISHEHGYLTFIIETPTPELIGDDVYIWYITYADGNVERETHLFMSRDIDIVYKYRSYGSSAIASIQIYTYDYDTYTGRAFCVPASEVFYAPAYTE